MRSKEDLFQLVQSMSKSEKRYFVLDAKKSGRSASRYLSLFDAMNSMEDYDEDKLKRQFPKNLSSDKAYLYEAILRSMRDYRSKNSKAAQVKERLMDARYLYERGLYEQSTGRIMEAKAMASELQDQFTLLEINKEEQISLFDRRAKVQLEHIEKLNQERKQTLKAINEELTYLDLYYRLLLEVFQEFNLKDLHSIEALKQRLPVELLEERNRPTSPQAVRRFYQCNATYYNLLGETVKVFHNFLNIVKWWEEYPALKEEEFHRYIIDISNLVNTGYENKEFHPIAQEWLDRLKREKSSGSHHNQRIIFFKLSISNLLHLLNQNDFENARKMLPEIIEGVNKFGSRKSIVLTGNIAIVYFLVEDYENCIYWADHIIKNLKNSGREDIQRIVRLYKLISHFELDEVEQVELEVRATQRYFKSHGLPKDRFENVLLNEHFRKIFNAPLNEVKPALVELKEFLEGIKNQPDTENPLGLDELLIYVERKL